MIQTLRRAALPALIVALMSVIVIGLLPRSEPESEAARIERLASSIRCPACNGASIADAQSSTARDYLIIIEEEVAAGATDQEIYDLFSGRFGESALLLPPSRGWGLWLIVLPLVAVAAGVVLIMNRRRRRDEPAASTAEAVDEGLDAIERDLDELEEQVGSGELEAATAERLRATYVVEQERLEERKRVLAERTEASGRDRSRMMAGAAILMAGGLAAGIAAGVLVRDDPGAEAAQGIIQEAVQAPVDLASVPNERMEEVVAENPDNIPMRMALARRYFTAGDFSNAIDHYFVVLDQQDNAEALANLGWISFTNNEAEIAKRYLDRSLEVDPDFPDALWFMANVQFYGLNDPVAATAPLFELLGNERLTDEDRAAVQGLMDEIEAAS